MSRTKSCFCIHKFTHSFFHNDPSNHGSMIFTLIIIRPLWDLSGIPNEYAWYLPLTHTRDSSWNSILFSRPCHSFDPKWMICNACQREHQYFPFDYFYVDIMSGYGTMQEVLSRVGINGNDFACKMKIIVYKNIKKLIIHNYINHRTIYEYAYQSANWFLWGL